MLLVRLIALKFLSKMREYEMREGKIESKLREVEEKLNYALDRKILIKDIICFYNLAKKNFKPKLRRNS